MHLVLAVSDGPDRQHVGVPKGVMLAFENMTVPVHSFISTLQATSKDCYLS